MRPVNTKSMMSVLCMTIDKLDEKKIQPQDAIAMSKLLAQADNLLTYELKRAVVLSNPETASHFRNIEEKAFDSVPDSYVEADKFDIVLREIARLSQAVDSLQKHPLSLKS